MKSANPQITKETQQIDYLCTSRRRWKTSDFLEILDLVPMICAINILDHEHTITLGKYVSSLKVDGFQEVRLDQ